MGGEPLGQIAKVVDEAKPGETVISKEAWPMVKDVCLAQQTEGIISTFLLSRVYLLHSSGRLTSSMNFTVHFAGGNYNIKSIENTPKIRNDLIIVPKMEKAIRLFIPNHVLAPLDAGREFAELRRVTVLFIVFKDLKVADDKSTLQQIQNIYLIIQQALKKYEGGIKEFSVDDKGVVAVIGFGLPPFGHEDDPARGVYAAFEITNAIVKIESKLNTGVTSKMGVTSGDVFCGTVGSASRREFAMIGDTVNLAARLMMKADTNGILCDNYT